MDIIRFETFCMLILGLFYGSSQFLLSSSPGDLERCPDTVAHGKYLHSFHEQCYEFVIYKEKYWSDARADCQSKGGDLVVVDDADIQQFIIVALITLGNTKNGLWIGLTDSRHELHWKWVNDEPLQGYKNWAHLQGGANALHLTQDCAQIRMNDNGRWHDRECHLWPQKFSYICQYDMLPALSTTGKPTEAASQTRSSTPTLTTTTTTTTATDAAIMSSRPRTVSDLYMLHITNHTSSPWQPRVSRLLSALTTESSETYNSPHTSPVNKQELPFRQPMFRNVTTVLPTATEDTSHNTAGELSTVDVAATRWDYSPVEARVTSIPAVKDMISGVTTTTERLVVCSELDCAKSCPNGYSGVFVDISGCINCRCN